MSVPTPQKSSLFPVRWAQTTFCPGDLVIFLSVKLPWQQDNSPTPDSTSPAAGKPVEPAASNAAPSYPKGYTPPKGRPTPKRAEQEIARGVKRDPNALSPAQAHQHRKELKKSMSKAEWKAYKQREREKSRERNRQVQERMAAGDERYLPLRDRGPERAYVRDWVDSRRFISEFAMPAALVMLLIMFIGSFAPRFATISSLFAMAFVVIFFAEGIWLARRANNAVRLNFPGTTQAGFSLGSYAFGRATQPRKWRTPRPRVERGTNIS